MTVPAPGSPYALRGRLPGPRGRPTTGGDRFTAGLGGWSTAGGRLPTPLAHSLALLGILTLCALYLWAALQPRHPMSPPAQGAYPPAFDPAPPPSRYTRFHGPPEVLWSWSNRLDDVYDDRFWIILYRNPNGFWWLYFHPVQSLSPPPRKPKLRVRSAHDSSEPGP